MIDARLHSLAARHCFRSLAPLASAALVALLAGSASAEPVTASFTHQGRTLMYRYTLDDLPDSNQAPGLLLHFHGNASGTQEAMLGLSSEFRGIAATYGLVPVQLASPDTRPGTFIREWLHDEDSALVHQFLQTGLQSQFSFDRNRIVFWGGSQGACFMHNFLRRHAASYGGGLYAKCGCAAGGAWDLPPDFENRFRVFIKATTEDFTHQLNLDAYVFYKYELGLETFGDLSEPGGHCGGGIVPDEDAVGWLLGARSLEVGDGDTQPTPGLPLDLTERRAAPGACSTSPVLQTQSYGGGNALWLPVDENAAVEIPAQNAGEVYFRIATVAGTGTRGDSGDGGAATAAKLNLPTGVAADAAGNVYVADRNNHVVRRIDAAGVITTVAGTGTAGFAGDGGPATAAQLFEPVAVAVDADGNVYVADQYNHRVRRIDAAGVITTVAGTGTWGYAGDGGPATAAKLTYPAGVAADAAGNVYVADQYNHRVRRIDAADVITTVAGTGTEGYAGDGGPATAAQLSNPVAVAVDAVGNVYVADRDNNVVRRIDTAGVITTVAGTGTRGHAGDGGPATAAQLSNPVAVAVDADGNVYVADQYNHRVRRIDAAGTITTVAGRTRISGYAGDGGVATAAQLSNPSGVAVDAAGNVYVADQNNNRVRVLVSSKQLVVALGENGQEYQLEVTATGLISRHGDPLFAGATVVARNGDKYSLSQRSDGTVIASRIAPSAALTVSTPTEASGTGLVGTIAGTGQWQGYPGDGGAATAAQLYSPSGVAVDAAGNTYVADPHVHRVRRVDAAGVITTVAGTGTAGFSGDGGPATSAQLDYPHWVAVDAAGNVYVADYYNHRVRRIDTAGVITTVAGTGTVGYSGDGGPATEANLRGPFGMAADAAGNLYVADTGNDVVRRIDAAGTITTVEWRIGALQARLHEPTSVAVDAAGNAYVAERRGHRVRRIDPAGGIRTVAGTGTAGYSGDGGPATAAQLFEPTGVAVDAAGNVYVADRGSHRVRRIDAVGTITTVAGTGTAGFSGDGGPATAAQLNYPHRVAVDAAGNLYVTDWKNNRVRRIDPAGTITTVAGTGTVGYSGDGGPATEAELNHPAGVAVDAAGNVYVADYYNNRVRRIDPAGTITTVAGTGTAGYAGDGGPATAANLYLPTAVAVDTAGNLYVPEWENKRVRRIDAAGEITTVAGTGTTGYSGDGGPATEALFNGLSGVAVDAAGNVFVADQYNDRVRRIDPEGTITTFAGGGTGGRPADNPFWTGVAVDAAGNLYVVDSSYSSSSVWRIDAEGLITAVAGGGYGRDGGPATEAKLFRPFGVAVDAAGNVFVADFDENKVRRIDAAGTITTVAGTGWPGYSGDGGPATEAQFEGPYGVAVDAAGNLYVADWYNSRVRFVSTAPYQVNVPLGSSEETARFAVSAKGAVTRNGQPVLAGSQVVVCNGGVYSLRPNFNRGLNAEYAGARQAIGLGDRKPITLVRDEAGTWRIGADAVRHGHRHYQGDREYILDSVDGQWRLATHAMRTVAGHSGVEGGVLATGATFYSPSSVAADSAGNLYVADRENNRVRRVDAAGMIATFAGTGDRGYGGDGGLAVDAQLDRPSSVAVDAASNVYVADTGNQRVRRIDLTGEIATAAGTGEQGYGGDGGPATDAPLDNPVGVATDAVGNVYVADSGNQRVRRIDLAGSIATFAGTGEAGYSGDGGMAAEARLDGPSGVAVDATGNVYVADYLNQRVRRIDTAGMITTVAGTGEAGDSGDGGSAVEAMLDGPSGVAADAAGNVYVADYLGKRVRRIDSAGMITTVAGTGEAGDSGDGGSAVEAMLDGPFGVAVDAAGNLYVADLSNHRIRRIDSAGNIATVAGTGEPFRRNDGGLATQAQFSHRLGDVAVDTAGNLYVADLYDNTVRQVDAAELISTFAGTGIAGYGGDGGAASGALLDSPSGVAADATGNLYVADTGNHRVRRIDPEGTITTFAGTGTAGYSGESHSATSSKLDGPAGVATDAAGNVYVLDRGNRRVRVVAPAGTMRTVAGNGESESPVLIDAVVAIFRSRDAALAPLIGATDLAVGSGGGRGATLFLGVGESRGQSRMWALPLGSIGIGLFFRDNDGGVVRHLAADAEGNVYFADGTAIRVKRPDGSIAVIAEADGYGISVGGMAVDEFGRIWFSDPEHRRVRVFEPVRAAN